MKMLLQLLRRVFHRRLQHSCYPQITQIEADEIPLVCRGYLPLEIQRELAIRDVRARHAVPLLKASEL